jgi:putative transcriptional regulator
MAQSADISYLDGQLLIAMPNIGDKRFERSVIYMCAHSAEGAMGIVINKTTEEITFSELLERLHIKSSSEPIELAHEQRDIMVHFGGPVETARGFVLHSSDYFADDATLPIDEEIGLTATLDVLRAMVAGEGPRQALLALGYAGWGPGQLETEIQDNGWLSCPCDQDLLFETALDAKYTSALAKIGIDPAFLTAQAGRA